MNWKTDKTAWCHEGSVGSNLNSVTMNSEWTSNFEVLFHDQKTKVLHWCNRVTSIPTGKHVEPTWGSWVVSSLACKLLRKVRSVVSVCGCCLLFLVVLQVELRASRGQGKHSAATLVHQVLTSELGGSAEYCCSLLVRKAWGARCVGVGGGASVNGSS